jgi:S-DNA-T family DNA segregation ATPase FtsK/SpoIIIE
MTTLTNKVLKTELFFLFLITSLSLAAFYFGEQLPDNYLSISSGQNDLGILSYIYSSVVVAVGYYLGPWTIVPFLIFALFYTLQFSRRNIPLDSLNFISVTGGSLFLFYIFAPEFLGKGIRFFIKNHFSFYEALSIGLILSLAFLAGSFRSSFKEASIQFFSFLGRLPGNLWHFTINLKPLQTMHSVGNFSRRLKETSLVRLPSLLKGGSNQRSRGVVSDNRNVVDAKGIRERFNLPKLGRKKVEDDASVNQTTSFTPIRENSDFIKDNDRDTDTEVKDSQKTYVQETFTPETDERKAKKQYQVKNEKKEEKQYYDIVTTMTDSRENRTQRHPDDDYFDNIISKIEDTLAEFKIDGGIVNILKGPVVDTFELELGSGVKVSKVTNAENEISMALLGAPIRIVYPMIGRATVGIEVPRNPREIIYLDEVLSTREFKSTPNKLPISMGKDAFGEPLVVDLASMPHMLVAGATGAGKSVFINYHYWSRSLRIK